MLPFLFKDMIQEYAAKPIQDYQAIYQKDKASYIKKILTGLQAGQLIEESVK
jgi:hypothetical protein